MTRPGFYLFVLLIGLLLMVAGAACFFSYANAPVYRSDSNLSGSGVARNQTNIYPSTFVVIVSIEPEELFFQYYFQCDAVGTYNFLFFFPFQIQAKLASTPGMNFNTSSYGSSAWIRYEVNNVGSYNVYGNFQVNDTFRTGTHGAYTFLLPFGGGIRDEAVSDLQSKLHVAFISPDTSLIHLSFVAPKSFHAFQTIPPTKGAPIPVPSFYGGDRESIGWELTELRDSVAVYCQNSGETQRYQVLLFFSGLLLSLGAEVLVTLAYDYFKPKETREKVDDAELRSASSNAGEFPIGRLFLRDWLSSLRTEYDAINAYRLEWAKTGHNYGWVVIPVSLTLPALVFGYVSQQGWRIALLVAFISCWFLLFFWRVLHHQIDHQIRLMYPRVIEIEETLDIKLARIWLKDQWKLGHLPSKQEALRRLEKKIDFSRGHLVLDSYCVLYFAVTLAISCVLWSMNWF